MLALSEPFKIRNSFCSEFPHKFVERLSETVTVTEDGKVELEVTVEDESAEVGWFHEDTEIKTEKSRSGLNADGKDAFTIKSPTSPHSSKIMNHEMKSLLGII